MSQNGKVQHVAIGKVKTAAFNPPQRTHAKSIAALKASIERVGIIYPLIVTQDYDLVDGHRRLECARQLGLENVPVIVREGDQRALFGEVNTTSKTLSTSDDLFVYLSGGMLTKRIQEQVKVLEVVMGREGLELLADSRVSPSSIVAGVSMVMAYLDRNEPNWRTGENKFARLAAYWLVEHRQTYRLRAAITMKMSPAVITGCIENNEPLP